MSKENKIFYIMEDDSGRRLDRVVRKFLENFPLSGIYSAIRLGKIKINNKKQKGSYLTQKGDKLSIDLNLFNSMKLLEKDKKQASVSIQKPDIILKTNDLLFINKKIGELVHGKNSLCDAVIKYFPQQDESLSFKAGALHRLDKDTSGILTFSQSLKGAQSFSRALQEGKIAKFYLGICEGKPHLNKFKSEIEGKECLCFLDVLEFSKEKNLSLVLFNLITGRKHQIRIQSCQFGTPLLNDKKYGSKQKSPFKSDNFSNSYFLHAYKLVFKEAFLEGLPSEIKAPLPSKFKETIKVIFNTGQELNEFLTDI